MSTSNEFRVTKNENGCRDLKTDTEKNDLTLRSEKVDQRVTDGSKCQILENSKAPLQSDLATTIPPRTLPLLDISFSQDQYGVPECIKPSGGGSGSDVQIKKEGLEHKFKRHSTSSLVRCSEESAIPPGEHLEAACSGAVQDKADIGLCQDNSS